MKEKELVGLISIRCEYGSHEGQKGGCTNSTGKCWCLCHRTIAEVLR